MTGTREAITGPWPILLALLALSVLSPGLDAQPAAAATPVACGDNLNVPGQYMLTGDLSCSGVFSALTITASDVHLTLNGFTLSGDGTVTFGIDVGLCVATSGVHINGGTVTGFIGAGIFLCNATNAHVNGMTVRENENGILLDGSDGNHINGNIVTDNDSDGLFALFSDNNEFNTNVVTENDGRGYTFLFSDNNRVTSNNVSGNLTDGIVLDVSDGNIVRGCTISGNEGDGIDLEDALNSLIQGNIVTANLRSGIEVEDGSTGNRIQGNTSTGNNTGMTATEADMVDNNPVDADCENNWKSNTFGTELGDTGCIK